MRAGAPSGPLVLAAGDVVAYDHRMPHRSGANPTDRSRPAVNVGLLPVGAPLLVHIWDDRRVVAHEVPDDFFAVADLGAAPDGWFHREPTVGPPRDAPS